MSASLRALAIALLAWFGAACGDDGDPLEPPPGPDAPIEPLTWSPKPGEYSNWDIQLHAPFDISAQRAMYTLDLFDVMPTGQTITYDDGTLDIPAGTLSTAIADLHAKNTIVVCSVGVGAIRLTDPDASRFPGFIDEKTAPPDNPTPPEADSVIGWSTNDANEPNERFLDVRAAARTTVMGLIGKRIQLAKKIGCDAVLAHKTFMGAPFDSGFAHTPAETLSFHADVSELAHTPADDTQIAIGMHNGYNGPSSDADLIDVYEFQIMEGLAAARQCCDDVRASINADHAAFALDVLSDDPDFPVTKEIACDQYDQGGMQDGLIKDALLSSTVREVCTAAKPR